MRNFILTLLLPVSLFAQTSIYRSVQPGVTAAIGTGTGTLTISGSTATFSVSQPDSVGVGDAIQYDSDGNGSIDAICFIHGRTSGTEYTVKNAAGAAPTAVTGDEDWDIYRAYISLANFENGTENTGINATVRGFDAGNRNLSTNSEQWNVSLYPGADVSVVSWGGWTTSATNYVNFYTPYLSSEVGTSQRKNLGKHNHNTYCLHITSNTAGNFDESGTSNSHIRFDGVQFQIGTGNGVNAVLFLDAGAINGDWRISNCVFVGQTTQSETNQPFYGIYIATGGGFSTRIRIWNNIFYDFNSPNTTDDGAIYVTGSGLIAYVFNNTMVNCIKGINWGGSGQAVHAYNNIAQGATDGYIGSLSGDYNLSNVASDAPGGNSLNETTLTFEDAGNDDYHLSLSDAAIAVGTDLSSDANLPFSTDIDGDTRTTWNMGADEFQGSTQNYYRRRLDQ